MRIFAHLVLALLLLPFSVSHAMQKICTSTESFPVHPASDPISSDLPSSKKLDILWVIDDSSSMESHQSNLKENIKHFFSVFDAEDGVDFQMGIVTTGLRVVLNEEGGQPLRLTSESTSADRKDFMKRLMVGVNGNPSEKGAAAVSEFMRVQSGYVRSGSQVQINILTDEDDETEPHQVHAVRNLLNKIQSDGHPVTINLIAIGGSIKRYRQHFQGFNLHFYPLLSDDFSKGLKKMAAKSIGRTILDFELQFEPKDIISIQHQTANGLSSVKHHEVINEHVLRTDLGVLKSFVDSSVTVVYQYSCTAINRTVSRKLIKRIAEIDFQPNQDEFLHPEVAHATVDDVYQFLKKNENTHIKLIGAVSYTANPLAVLKMRIMDPQEYPNAYRLSKSRAKKIKDELIARGIDPDRIQSKGAMPGFHRHWYSYLLDLTFYDLVSEFCLACEIESDRRVIMKMNQK